MSEENRVEVWQNGRRIGWMPTPYTRPHLPVHVKDSGHFLVQWRPGDFTVQRIVVNNGWTELSVVVLSRTLGPGDIEAIPGFRWDPERHGPNARVLESVK